MIDHMTFSNCANDLNNESVCGGGYSTVMNRANGDYSKSMGVFVCLFYKYQFIFIYCIQ